MKRLRINLEEISNRSNLLLALHKASQAKHHRENVKAFYKNVEKNLATLSVDILEEKLPYGNFHSFKIYDPKKRWIHAACFEDRIFHHAVMNLAGEKLENAMFYHSYACRPNKGVHKAVTVAQKNLQRFAYLVKIDISAYFSCINHDRLYSLLKQCFKGHEFHFQLMRIIKSCPEMRDQGLPIGSLTSQYFANYYLDGLDRFLSSNKKVKANIRYMDDVIWWSDTKREARLLLADVKAYLKEERFLEVKPSVQILKSSNGVSYCGYRISQGAIRLSRRRKKSIIQKRHYWEQKYRMNEISAYQLQKAYASIHAISQGTDSLEWRKKQLQEKPAVNG